MRESIKRLLKESMTEQELEEKLRAIADDAFKMAGQFAGRDATCTMRADDGQDICSMIHDLSLALIEIMKQK